MQELQKISKFFVSQVEYHFMPHYINYETLKLLFPERTLP